MIRRALKKSATWLVGVLTAESGGAEVMLAEREGHGLMLLGLGTLSSGWKYDDDGDDDDDDDDD